MPRWSDSPTAPPGPPIPTYEELLGKIEVLQHEVETKNSVALYLMRENAGLKRKLSRPAPRPDFSKNSSSALGMVYRLREFGFMKVFGVIQRLARWSKRIDDNMQRTRFRKAYGIDMHKWIQERWNLR